VVPLFGCNDTVVGGTVAGVTAFSVTTIATACPPIAIALTAAAPALTVVGNVRSANKVKGLSQIIVLD